MKPETVRRRSFLPDHGQRRGAPWGGLADDAASYFVVVRRGMGSKTLRYKNAIRTMERTANTMKGGTMAAPGRNLEKRDARGRASWGPGGKRVERSGSHVFCGTILNRLKINMKKSEFWPDFLSMSCRPPGFSSLLWHLGVGSG